MEVVYRGFDGLDVAFRGHIPNELAAVLDEAKAKAAETLSPTLVKFGGVNMHVAETGSKGGYAFRCDTGPEGAVWFFKKPKKNDPWGVRVSIKSLPLALYGLGRVRANMYRFLDALGIYVAEGAESIGRVDYAIDVLLPNFEPVPQNFVMHSHTNRADHEEFESRRTNGVSSRITSVTIGKMPGRQVIVYDKRLEVIQKRKLFWWEIWNANRRDLGKPLFDPKCQNTSRIWRIEIRAGKKHLKDRWGISKWADLDEKLGDVFLRTLEDIRYVVPNNDANRARWPVHPIWALVQNEISGDLFEMVAHCDPGVVKAVIKEQQRSLIEGQMVGLSASFAALNDVDRENCGIVPELVSKPIADFITSNPEIYSKKLEKAGNRYVFLE